MLGAMMVSEATIEPVILDIHLQAEDFYRDRHRTIFEAIIRLNEAASPVDVLTVSEAALPARQPRDGRRPRRGRQPRGEGAGARQRPPLRADRQAERAHAAPRRRREADPAVGRRARRRADRAGRAGRAAPLPGRPRGARRRLPRARARSSTRRSTSSRRSPRELRTRPGPCRASASSTQITGGFQSGQPDRDRREAGDGEKLDRLQHRRERGAEAQEAGGAVLAGDVGDGARPPLHRLPGPDPGRPAAQGQGLEQGLAEGGRRPATARIGRPSGSTTPPTSDCSSCGRRPGACMRRRRAAAATGSGW